MDRRTDRPDGSGGGSPTVVTTRATGDDLTGNEQDARASDVIAPPRRSPQATKPAPAKSSTPDGAVPDGAASDGTPGAGHPANGAPTAGNGIDRTKDASANGAVPNGSSAVKDGAPALPADSIRASRSTKPPGPDPETETAASKAAEQSPDDDAPTASFGVPSSFSFPSGSAGSAADGDPAELAAKPSRADASPSAGQSSAGQSSAGQSSAGQLSAGQSRADLSAVPPAAFAWEMPDPPAESPSSPARNFLRSGISLKGSAPKGSASSQAAAPQAAAPESPPKTAAAKPLAGEGPVTMRNTTRKGQSKRSARQAHLTIARVEPWSVMKFSFVVSLVAFVILFVAVIVLYGVLSGLGVFDSLQRVVQSITSSQTSTGVNAKAWFSASKVLGYTALLGSLNIVLITAMSTIGSVVYNLTSRLVGGVEVTLRETE